MYHSGFFFTSLYVIIQGAGGKDMDKNKKVSFDIIVYSMMIVAVIYAIVQSLSGHNNEIYYKLILGIWILLAVVLSDFVEPMINRTFEEFSGRQMYRYMAYAITDAASYMAMYIFVINVGIYKEPFHYIFLAAGVLLFILKFILYKKFEKKDNRENRIDEILKKEREEEEELRKARFECEKEDDDVEVDTLDDEDILKVFKSHDRNGGI